MRWLGMTSFPQGPQLWSCPVCTKKIINSSTNPFRLKMRFQKMFAKHGPVPWEQVQWIFPICICKIILNIFIYFYECLSLQKASTANHAPLLDSAATLLSSKQLDAFIVWLMAAGDSTGFFWAAKSSDGEKPSGWELWALPSASVPSAMLQAMCSQTQGPVIEWETYCVLVEVYSHTHAIRSIWMMIVLLDNS